MAEYPDSALIFLESIPFPQKLSRADRALYALLLTQARYKNYITLDDDSLIKVAVDYYGKRKVCGLHKLTITGELPIGIWDVFLLL